MANAVVGARFVLIDHIVVRVMDDAMDFVNGEDVTIPSGQRAEVVMSMENDTILQLEGGKYSGKYVVVSNEDLEFDWVEE